MPAKTATACTAPHHHVHDASDFVAVVGASRANAGCA